MIALFNEQRLRLLNIVMINDMDFWISIILETGALQFPPVDPFLGMPTRIATIVIVTHHRQCAHPTRMKSHPQTMLPSPPQT